jgi:hypothetical protein
MTFCLVGMSVRATMGTGKRMIKTSLARVTAVWAYQRRLKQLLPMKLGFTMLAGLAYS